MAGIDEYLQQPNIPGPAQVFFDFTPVHVGIRSRIDNDIRFCRGKDRFQFIPIGDVRPEIFHRVHLTQVTARLQITAKHTGGGTEPSDQGLSQQSIRSRDQDIFHTRSPVTSRTARLQMPVHTGSLSILIPAIG
jgi:hypothetical protein